MDTVWFTSKYESGTSTSVNKFDGTHWITWAEISSSRGVDLPTKIVFSGDHTHVFWKDGSKVSVIRKVDDPYDPEHAVASAIAHRLFGSKTKFRKFVKSGYNQPIIEKKKK
jgi:hypothetical protein